MPILIINAELRSYSRSGNRGGIHLLPEFTIRYCLAVLGPPLFLIMISDIDKNASASRLVSFADETRLYSGVGDVTDSDNLHFDLNAVYDWVSSNNMFFMFVSAPTCLPISQICILTMQ